MVSPGLINQLQGRNRNIQNNSFQYMIQPGRNTIISHDLYNSINDPATIDPLTEDTGLYSEAADTTNTCYFWNQKLTMTLQNHGVLPFYITARYYRSRTNVPISLGSIGAVSRTDSPRMGFLRHALLEYGVASSSFVQGQQGIYKTGKFQVAEGFGDGAPADTAAAPRIYSESDPTTYSFGVPLGITSRCHMFNKIYDNYHTKSFVLGAEQMTSLTLQDTDMHWREEVAANGGEEVDPFSQTYYLDNSYSKFIILEVHGGLVGQDPEVAQLADEMATTWSVTTAATDDVNFSTIHDRVTTSGGILYVHYHKGIDAGLITNLNRPDVNIDVNLKEVGWAANPFGPHAEMPVKGS